MKLIECRIGNGMHRKSCSLCRVCRDVLVTTCRRCYVSSFESERMAILPCSGLFHRPQRMRAMCRNDLNLNPCQICASRSTKTPHSAASIAIPAMTAPTWAMSFSICKNAIPSHLYTPTSYDCSNLDQNFRLFLVLALIEPPVTKVLKAA